MAAGADPVTLENANGTKRERNTEWSTETFFGDEVFVRIHSVSRSHETKYTRMKAERAASSDPFLSPTCGRWWTR
jgi:hypothetical protein